MSTLNRWAIIVRPKQPYIDWANSFDGPRYDEADPEPNVYLAPGFAYTPDLWEWLKEGYPFIFEEELWLWMTQEADWPPDRDYAMFEQWFEVEVSSMVIDLCDRPPEWDEE
jgi:hypothetical protein